MGACQSSQDGEEEEKKKRSRLIDARLLEDERRLRKECKILLLGTASLSLPVVGLYVPAARLLTRCRIWRERQVNHCQANENYPPERLYER